MVGISDLLVAAGLTRERLEECRRISGTTGESLDRIILSKEYLEEAKLLQAYASHLGYDFLPRLDGFQVPAQFVNRIPVQFTRNYNLIALAQTDGGCLKVATCSPLEAQPMDDLAALLGSEIEPVLAPRTEITTLIARAYRHKADGVDEALADVAEDGDIQGLASEIEEAEDVLDVSNKAPIIKLVNTILFQGLKLRASDVHFHPYPERTQVRFRIDGILYDMDSVPRKAHEAIISRVKVMGKMDIAERRLPQDGRATIKLGDGEVDVRISSVPTTNGERIVMRLLDKSAKIYTLEEIGLSQKNLVMMRDYVTWNHGIILVTGPTGSGKTTTLYAALQELNRPDVKIITAEDPVEYHIEGINQVQINSRIGLTFARILKAMLRCAPNVVLVGEIRDLETAEIAIQAALTGHLVFSTLHTNDAPSALTRLMDLGVKPFLVSAAVQATVAQRLVRRLCSECAIEYVPDPEELTAIGLDPTTLAGKAIRKARGCRACESTGYRGRVAVFETLEMDTGMREDAFHGASLDELRSRGLSSGALRPLMTDGARKVLAGTTSVAEILRVTRLEH
jgi:general secretion pathway protein E